MKDSNCSGLTIDNDKIKQIYHLLENSMGATTVLYEYFIKHKHDEISVNALPVITYIANDIGRAFFFFFLYLNEEKEI